MRKLSTKLVAVAAIALLIALASIGLTLLVSWQLEGTAAAINDAGSLRMRVYRLAYLAGRDASPATMLAGIDEYDRILETLRRGDPARPLFLPSSRRVQDHLSSITSAWAEMKRALSDGSGASLLSPAQIQTFVGDVDRLVALAEEEVASSTALLRAAQFGLIALAIAGTIGFMYLSFLLVVRPVEHLEEGLERMARGEFDARLPIETNDEFGALARGFNTMGERLQDLYASLEERVEQKTRSLAEQNARLATLYDLAAFFNRGGPAEELSRGALARLAASVQADAGFVRLQSTDGRMIAVAHHGASPGFIAEERCIARDACACGAQQARAAGTIEVLRADAPAIERMACSRAGYRTVANFAVAHHGESLGVLTLLFRDERAFDRDTRQMLTTSAHNLGAALVNVRVATLERATAVAKERNMLAEQLHDSIAQSLAFVNLQVQMLVQALGKADAARAQAVTAEIRDGVQECFGDVRELMHHFRTSTTQEDVIEALETMAQRFKRQAGLDVTLRATGAAVPLDPEVRTQVMHILHEALSNVRKHAATDHVTIAIDRNAGYRFTVTDAGRGFDPEASRGEDHIGLRIMRDRAERIGASLEVRSRPGGGTSVTLALPEPEGLAA